GESGLRALVAAFYDGLEASPAGTAILSMHTRSREEMCDRLTLFLCGWLGGPRLYGEKYGAISIPGAHAPFPIGVAERDTWLGCMQMAIEAQPWAAQFKDYLIKALSVPAGRVTKYSLSTTS
ncbi:MAG: group II truncated hemoglobin, partial [Gammaproteobacteria bacterium]|nr:group II truncated hemoglobin [Gammaproteobacteria bacterium]